MDPHPRTLTLLLALTLAAPAAAQTDYDATFAEARRLEAEGHPGEAAQALEGLTPDYPQDYRLWLQLGWLRFQSGAYGPAEAAYRKAVSLSGGAVDARLGLAWTLLRQDRRVEAAEAFRAILADDPGQASAKEGLALATRPVLSLAPTLSLSVLQQGGGVTRIGLGVLAGLDALVRGQVLVGGAYRDDRLAGTLSSMRGRRMSGAGPSAAGVWEAHLHAGWVGRRVGVLGLFAVAGSSDATVGQAWIGGLSVRYSPFGDGILEASYSAYPALGVARLAPSWRLPLGRGLSIVPGLGVQHLVPPPDGALPTAYADTPWPVSGFLGLRFDRPGFALWAGGKLGDEVRPAYLYQPVVWAIPERISGGAWAGASVAVGGGYALLAAWELQRLEGVGALGAATESLANVFTFGLARTP